jgi:hypothetical protein
MKMLLLLGFAVGAPFGGLGAKPPIQSSLAAPLGASFRVLLHGCGLELSTGCVVQTKILNDLKRFKGAKKKKKPF